MNPVFLDADHVRQNFEHWHRDRELVERFMEGLGKAGLCVRVSDSAASSRVPD